MAPDAADNAIGRNGPSAPERGAAPASAAPTTITSIAQKRETNPNGNGLVEELIPAFHRDAEWGRMRPS
jgi:hypothetical protein